jgi:hypothetical protein
MYIMQCVIECVRNHNEVIEAAKQGLSYKSWTCMLQILRDFACISIILMLCCTLSHSQNYCQSTVQEAAGAEQAWASRASRVSSAASAARKQAVIVAWGVRGQTDKREAKQREEEKESRGWHWRSLLLACWPCCVLCFRELTFVLLLLSFALREPGRHESKAKGQRADERAW